MGTKSASKPGTTTVVDVDINELRALIHGAGYQPEAAPVALPPETGATGEIDLNALRDKVLRDREET